MPDIVYGLVKSHRCYKCHKLIKQGKAAKVWHYSDKKLYQHTKECERYIYR